jgi:(+)-trans-carveol dehydrogenase
VSDSIEQDFAGKVVFITGVGRGQGRSHALAFARRGADVAGIDICAPIMTVPYDMATEDDLRETRERVGEIGVRTVLEVADVRDRQGLQSAASKVLDELGRIDVVVANAGIFSVGDAFELTPQAWQDVLDVNLTGAWNTVQSCLPALVASGSESSIILTSSIGGVQGLLGCPHYVASKHGLLGLMRSLANELGAFGIRVNAVCPTNVNTPMIQNEANYRTFRPDLESPTEEQVAEMARKMHILDVPWIEAEEVSDAVTWLASSAAKSITGVALPIDAGLLTKVAN